MQTLTPPGSSSSLGARYVRAPIVIAMCGMITSMATVAANYAVNRWLNLDVLSISFWLVIPAGGLIGGMSAASGYYVGARATQTMPSRQLLWAMVALGGCTWLLSKWVPYTLRSSSGTRPSDLMSFWDYIWRTAEHVRLSIGARAHPQLYTTGELGELGLWRECLQAVAFMAGGVFVHRLLSTVEACSTCKRYAAESVLLNGASFEGFCSVLEGAQLRIPELNEDVQYVLDNRPLVGMSLYLYRCPKCEQEWFRPAVVYRLKERQHTTKMRRYTVDADVLEVLRDCATRVQGQKAGASAA